MDAFDWKAFLSQWAEQLLRRAKESGEVEVPPDVLQSNWLGFPGATEAQLQRAEARLGTNLPRSYRDFLKTTNGWRQVDDWMPASAGHFLSAEEINWYPAKQP